MALKLISEPAALAVSVEEALEHVKSDAPEEDAALVELYVRAATGYADGAGGFLGRALVDQTWELVLDAFPTAAIVIPLPPLLELVSIKYDDADGDEQTLDESAYRIDDVSEPGRVLPTDTWPTAFSGVNAVRVRFRAGYVDMSGSPTVGEVPAEIKAAILLHTGSLYANRDSIIMGVTPGTVPFTAEMLLRKKRVELGMA